jgi:hypothetical protein
MNILYEVELANILKVTLQAVNESWESDCCFSIDSSFFAETTRTDLSQAETRETRLAEKLPIPR